MVWWGALGSGFTEGQNLAAQRDRQAKDDAISNAVRQQEMQARQQQMQETLRQQQMQKDLAAKMMQYYAQQQPQTPEPGQASVPMQQPQPYMPLPQGQSSLMPNTMGAMQAPQQFSLAPKPQPAQQPTPQPQGALPNTALQPQAPQQPKFPPMPQTIPVEQIEQTAWQQAIKMGFSDPETTMAAADNIKKLEIAKQNDSMKQWKEQMQGLKDQAETQKAMRPDKGTPVMQEAATLYGEGTPQYKAALAADLKKKDYIRPIINVNAGGAGGDLTPDSLDMMARSYIKDKTSISGLGFGKDSVVLRKKIINRAAAIIKEEGGNPDLAQTHAEYQGVMMALKDREKGFAMLNQFLGQFKGQAGIVKGYLDKGPGPSGMPIIDRWIQAGRVGVGDPDIVAFDNAIRGLSREHQRIVTAATSNAQLHASAQATADQLLNRTMNSKQVLAGIGEMESEINIAKQAGTDELKSLKSSISDIGKAEKPTQQQTAFKKLPSGVKLSPGMHTDKNGNKIEVMQDGTYREVK